MCAAAAVLPFESCLGQGAVQISPGLLAEIRDRVLDGYAAAPHGGVEVGFVLLGRQTPSCVSIEFFREIPCAHLLSPRFLLSSDEEKQFPKWMDELATDPELDGVEIVGWGCSHHRSDLGLLDREIAFHRRYFSEDNRVVMVVKPQSMQAILAGVFWSGNGGLLHPDTPAVQLRSAMLDGVLAESSKAPDERSTRLEKSVKMREAVQRFPDTERMMKMLEKPPKRFHLSVRWIGAAAGIAVLAVLLTLGLASGFHLPAAPTRSPVLAVGIRPQGNTLVFTWKGNIARVKSATVEVLDGTAASRFDITTSFQPAGVLVFPYKTGNVQTVLTLRTDSGKVVRSIGFIDGRSGVDNRSAITVIGSERDAAARLDATNRRLAALVSVLQSREHHGGK